MRAVARLGATPRRYAILLAIVAALFGSILVGAVYPTPAFAAATPSITTMGGPVNILPSAAKSAAGGYSSVEYLAAYLYKASKSPEFWAAYKAAQDRAAATGKPLALEPAVAAEAKTVYPAAQKVAPLVKTVGKAAGTAGAVITAYQVGSTLTNGTMDLIGLDATGTVCTGTGRDLWGSVVQTAAGANCAAYDQKMLDTFKPNQDASGGGLSTKVVCSIKPENGCAQLLGTGAWTSSQTVYCIAVTSVSTADSQRNVGFIYGIDGPSNVVSQSGWAYRDKPYDSTCPAPTAGALSAGIVIDNASKLYGFTFSENYTAGRPLELAGESSADPSRTLKCVIAGTDGKKYTGVSDEFLESGGVLPKVNCPDLPMGVMADTTDVVETGGSADDTIWSAKTDENVKNALTKYGECGTTSVCPLVLSKNGKSCFSGADCAGWYEQADHTPYKCTYGTHAVALSECTIYANRWEPEAVRTGDNLSDPATGKPLPNPKPSLQPGTDTAVSTGPVTDPDKGSAECFPSGWGAFNPLNWVLQPVRCALEWAFVPRASVMQKTFDDMSTTTDKSGIGSFKSIVAGFTGFAAPAVVCQGPPFTLKYFGQTITSHPFNACSEPMKGAAATLKAILTAVMMLASTLAVVRYVTSIFGGIQFGSGTQDTGTTYVDSRTGEVL